MASELKKRGIVTEYVPEYAKELVWEGRRDRLDGSFKNQCHIFSKQHHRLQRLIGKVDVIVTDAPLLLSAVYAKERKNDMSDFALEMHNQYNNFNLFINRGKHYEQAGRVHTLEQSKEIDREIKAFLEEKIFTMVHIIIKPCL